MAGAREAAITEAMELLAECEVADTGCFASDGAAYIAMQGRSPDVGDRISMRRMVTAATDAGAAGIPLEEATYVTWQLVPDTESIEASLAEHPHRDPGHPSKIVDGPEARVIDHLGSETAPDNMSPRIIRCAYKCGRAGVGHCPVLLNSSDQD